MDRRGRRSLLQGLAGLAAAALGGCGGGGGEAGSGAGGSTGSASGSGTTTGTTTGSTTTSTTSGNITDPWPWAGAGTSTVARLQSLDDFVAVLASGTLNYAFHASATSSTTDPVTGAVQDTGSQAALVPYRLARYLVTNANWKAFCDSQGSTYWPSTARTAGQYWHGGAYPAGKEDHPVFFVSATAAEAYCAWLETQIPGYRFYLPTEGEWEYAALGTQRGYSFPWGSSSGLRYDAGTGTLTSPFNCNAVCTQYVLRSSGLATLTYRNDSIVTTLADGSTPLADDSAPLASVLSLNASGSVSGWQYDSSSNRTWADFANSDQFRLLVDVYGGYSSAVGSFPAGASWCGCQDMAGNAYEWTSTLNLATNGAESGTQVRCIKGGSWYATGSSGSSVGRGEGRSPSGAYHSVGFRVAARAKA